MATTLVDEHHSMLAPSMVAPRMEKPEVPEVPVTPDSSSMVSPRSELGTSGVYVMPHAGVDEVALLETRFTDQTVATTHRGTGLVSDRSHIIQEWEGVVTWVTDDAFGARLYEGNRDFPVSQVEIKIEEVAEQARMITLGAAFTWFIGYRIRGSSRTRMSEITFRNRPAWTNDELNQAKIQGEKLIETAGWNSSECTTA